MNASDHRVRRQSWCLAARSAEEAFALRLQLRTALEHELPAALERAFDKAAPGGETLHIPKLELRLRVASLDALAAALAEAIAREVDLQPRGALRPAALERLQVLLHYLERGALAWHATQRDAPEAAAELRAAALAELAQVVRRAPAGPASFSGSVRYFFRLLELLPAERWPELAAQVDAIVRAPASPAGPPPTTTHPVTRDAGRTVITSLIGAPPSLPSYELRMVAAVVLASLREPMLRGLDLAHALSASSGAAIGEEDERHAFPANEDLPEPELAPGLARLPKAAAAFFAARLAADAIPAAVERRASAPAPLRTRLQTAPRHEAAPEGTTARAAADSKPAREPQGTAARPFAWFVSNAGLVLLHPYLPRLLEYCELYRGRRLRELPRAAALLHWLATGREEVHEFELGFVKLLLGLAPDAPLAVGAGLLGARERDEADALLRAAIGHWRALKSTSVEALRLCFLQRRGALREDEAGWRLELEAEAFDVLLARLPWAISTLRLPWMTRPLYTDWPTP